MATQVHARRAFDYGEVTLDVGQVTELRGYPKDGQLLDVGYLIKVQPGTSLAGCGHCGGKFVTDAFLNMHGRKRHSNLSEEEKDALAVREDRMYTNDMPLNYDRTSAERGTKPRGRGRRASA